MNDNDNKNDKIMKNITSFNTNVNYNEMMSIKYYN